MWEKAIRDGGNFAELAVEAGFAPSAQPIHGAEAMELMNLAEAAEELGDHVLSLARSGQMNLAAAQNFLDRILGCYQEPFSKSRNLAQLRIEIGKFKS
jgi:hypothetical protein